MLISVVGGVAAAEHDLWKKYDRGEGVPVSIRTRAAAVMVALEVVFVEWPRSVLRRED